jgi:hypothetical protein
VPNLVSNFVFYGLIISFDILCKLIFRCSSRSFLIWLFWFEFRDDGIGFDVGIKSKLDFYGVLSVCLRSINFL